MARDIFGCELRSYPEETNIRPPKPYKESKSKRFIKVFDGVTDILSPRAFRLLVSLSAQLKQNNELGERLYPARIERLAKVDYKTARYLYTEFCGANAIKDNLGVTFVNPYMMTRFGNIPKWVYELFDEGVDDE